MRSLVIAAYMAVAIATPAGAADDGKQADPTVEALLQSLGYLTADQAKELYERLNSTERMNAFLAAGKAKGAPRTIEVDFLKPNAKNSIRLAANRITAIQVLDQNGKPWPIADFIPAPRDSLGIDPLGSTGSVLAVSPLVRYTRGNAVLSLENLEIPISFSFETGENSFDEPLTIKIRDTYRSSGTSEVQAVSSQASGYDPSNDQVQQFLDGLIPRDARKIPVDAPFDLLVWRMGDDLVIKTEAELLYPGHRVRKEKGRVRVFVVDPIEMLQFTYRGQDALIEVEY